MGILAVFSGWLLIAAIIVIILIFAILEQSLRSSKNNGGGVGVTALLIIFIALYFWKHEGSFTRTCHFFTEHPLKVVLYSIAYISIGVVVSMVKWLIFLRDTREDNNGTWGYGGRPTAKKNSNRIITWMAYWPFALAWTLIDEPFIKLFRYLHKNLSGLYDKMAIKFFGE